VCYFFFLKKKRDEQPLIKIKENIGQARAYLSPTLLVVLRQAHPGAAELSFGLFFFSFVFLLLLFNTRILLFNIKLIIN
jgi:hypothetical protein